MRYVLGLIYNQSINQVLQLKAAPDWQKGRYNGIGGKIEEGEEPHEAMLREGIEEIGVDNIKWVHKSTMFVDGHCIYVYATALSDHLIEYATRYARNNTQEPLLLCWLDQMPKNILTNLKFLVPMIADPKMIMSSVIMEAKS